MSEKPDRLDCKETVWITPEKVLLPLRNYFKGPIPLDPCTESDNPLGASLFFTDKTNGLSRPWNKPVYCNPPYGKRMIDWLLKVDQEAYNGQEIILIQPVTNRFETGNYQNCLFTKYLDAICFIRGRVRFLRPVEDGSLFSRHYEAPSGTNNMYASMLLGYNVRARHFERSFEDLGTCLMVRTL